MNVGRERMLRDLMAVDFAVIDMHLYLDTHPYDQRAISIFNQNVQRSKMLRDNYERQYGPLTPLSYSKCPFEWVEGAWPWEREVVK